MSCNFVTAYASIQAPRRQDNNATQNTSQPDQPTATFEDKVIATFVPYRHLPAMHPHSGAIYGLPPKCISSDTA
eukprot:5427332-Pyramimonas_sp.AAC.1